VHAEVKNLPLPATILKKGFLANKKTLADEWKKPVNSNARGEEIPDRRTY